MSNEYDRSYVEGASASINKTINDINNILEGVPLEIEGKLREALRETIISSLADVAKKWYKKGFNRGHKESYRLYYENNEFPEIIQTVVSRKLIPNAKKRIRLKSRLKESFIEEIEESA